MSERITTAAETRQKQIDEAVGLRREEDAAALAEQSMRVYLDARSRISIDDPKSPYFRRPDLAASALRDLEDLWRLHRGGEPPAPPSPVERAQAVFDARFPPAVPDAKLVGMLDEAVEKIGALDEREQTRRAAVLRQEIGAERYDQMVKDAQSAVNEPLTTAAKAHRPTLDYLAALGRHERGRQQARPR